MAMCYDSLLLLAVIMAYGAIHLEIKTLLLGDVFTEQLRTAPAGSQADPLMFIGTLTSIFLFFHIFWHKKGQTLGMQVWRIQIRQTDGQMISAPRTALRLLVAPFSMACLGLGYLWCLFGKRQTWQDLASHTQTLLLPATKAHKTTSAPDSTTPDQQMHR
jgi:uncharacterized RDD family membrane protein YckC